MAAALPLLKTETKNPLTLSWPPTLAIELALKTATPAELQIEYGYTDEQWDALKDNPVFLKELALACEAVREEGMSFKLKARLLAEDNLDKTYRMIHAHPDDVPANVKKDLILATARWAGFDNRGQGGGPDGVAAGNGNMLAIQINLGKDY